MSQFMGRSVSGYNEINVAVCNFCEGCVNYWDKIPRYHSQWARKNGMRELIEKTNPELGEVDEASPPTDAQFLALLDGIAIAAPENMERTKVENLGCVGIFVLTITGFLICGSMQSEFRGVLALAILALGLTGAIVLVLTIRRNAFRRSMRSLVDWSIKKHKLDREALKEFARSHQHKALVGFDAD
jgi:hypothetical protein